MNGYGEIADISEVSEREWIITLNLGAGAIEPSNQFRRVFMRFCKLGYGPSLQRKMQITQDWPKYPDVTVIWSYEIKTCREPKELYGVTSFWSFSF